MGESCWTEAHVFVFPPKTLLLIPPAAWLSGKKGKSVSTSCIVEQEHFKLQPVNQQQQVSREPGKL